VVKEGRILHFGSGSRRFVLNNGVVQVVAGSIISGTVKKFNFLRRKSVSGFLFHARFTPGFGQKWFVLC